MSEIRFDTGEKTFDLNGKVEVRFNPADMLFLERLYKAAEDLDAAQTAFAQAAGKQERPFDLARECESKMRGIIDALFGVPVCDKLFDGVSVFAAGDGFPLWSNLLFAIIDQMDDSLTAQKTRAQERVRKYSAKYKR